MATVTEIEVEQDAAVEEDFPAHTMTLDRYKKLIEAGVYLPNEPVFLWKGRLVEKMGKGDPHIFSTSALIFLFARMLPDGWIPRSEQPIALSDNSMPEPDLTVLRGSFRDYVNRSAIASGDVAMVVEVAASSLRIDSKVVLPSYAAEGIPVYWIVNLVAGRIEVYSQPTGPGESLAYRERRDYGPDDEIPVVLDGREVGRIAGRDILP